MYKIRPKRIGIDARFYGPVGKGLGRYTQEIVDNITKIDSRNQYVVFLGPHNFDEFALERENVRKIMVRAGWYSLAEQILMPFYVWRARLDLMHWPHFNVPIFTPGKFVVTIHDLILTKFPTRRATTLSPWLYKIKNLAYRLVIWLAVKRARRIIAVSQFTKDDIVQQFKIRPEKITVTYEGVANLAKGRDSLFAAKLDDKETLLGYNIDSPFLLYVGNAYPHKNLEGLVRVFGKLVETQNFASLRLVLVGKKDYFYERVQGYARKLGLYRPGDKNSPIVFPGYVPDAKLEILYKQARAYVFPSLYEGFGLPPLEAMAKGCPVISSNRASLPEVLGPAAVYFDPGNEKEMLEQIKRVINNEDQCQDLIKKGLAQVKKYSWWECARKTLEVYINS